MFRDSKLKQKNPAAAHAKNNSAFSSFRFSAVYPSELASVWSWLKTLQRDMMKVAFAQNYTTEWQKTNMEPSWFIKMSKCLPSFRSNHIKSPCPEWLHTKIRQWIVVVHSSEKKNTSNLIFPRATRWALQVINGVVLWPLSAWPKINGWLVL